MDFHSLLRRDLQFLCKRNKIPANMTNLAMADALKSLEIVEGLDEYMNQKDSNVLQSPTCVAKLPKPSTATRTTRRKTATKAEPQSSAHLVSRLTSKSLDGEIDQENVTGESKANNVKIEANVAKTPAARSTRKASAAAATCGSKVQERKKGDLVQSAYSTRRSNRLLEKCMADLSLITKETEQKVSAKEKNTTGSEEISEEAEVIPGRDLSASMEKEWEMLENDSDHVTGGLEISVEKIETMEVMSDGKESENSLVQEDKQEETLQTSEAVCEEGLKKNANDQEIVDLEDSIDLDEIPDLEHANSETNNDNKESNIQAFESLGQVNQLEIEQAIQENDSEPEKVNTFHEERGVDQPEGDSETEPEENDSGAGDLEISVEKTETMEVMSDEKESENSLVQEETLQTNEAVCEEGLQKNDNDQETTDFENCVDLVEILVFEHANIDTNDDSKEWKDVQAFESLGQVHHLEIEQAIEENDSEPEKVKTFDKETVVYQTDGDSQTEPDEVDSCVDVDSTISETNQAGHQEKKQATQENDSETVKINTSDEATMVDQTDSEEDDSGVDSDGTISEADSNQAVQGSDIAEEEMILSEPEGSVTAPTSPSPLLEEAKVKAAPVSPFSAESIYAQFPRPNKSAATTPSKNSAMKLFSVDNNNKENDMEMMVNVSDNGEIKAEAKKQKKKVEFNEENLKDVSMRQLVKMVKELSIKGSNNRTALQILPGNNQIAE